MDAAAFDPLRLRQRLLDHGVDLNPGLARCPDWMMPPMRAIHSCFDGWDCETYIGMWSAEKIEAERADSVDRVGLGSLVIGDSLIFSDVVDGGDLCRPVRFLFEDRVIVASYESLWEELLSGEPSWWPSRRARVDGDGAEG